MDITKKGKTEKNIVLRSRDIVYIPATLGARIGMAVQNVLYPVRPVESLGSTAARAQTGGALGFSGQISGSSGSGGGFSSGGGF